MSLFQDTPPKRNRLRDGAGKSENSWQKHEILKKVINSYAGVARHFKYGTGLAIDMHAGDAKGVPHPQGDFFRITESTTSPAILYQIAQEHQNFDILLCELLKNRRDSLSQAFPHARILKDHSLAADYLKLLNKLPSWAIVVNDPCGHGKHGIDHMEAIGKILRRVDFVIVHPYGSLCQHLAVDPNVKDTDNALVRRVRETIIDYEWMRDEKAIDRDGNKLPSIEWADRLNRKHLACTRVINASPRFRYRVIVVSNFLTDAIKRDKLFQVIR